METPSKSPTLPHSPDVINGTSSSSTTTTSTAAASPPGQSSPYRSANTLTPISIFANTTPDASANDLKRYKRYIEWCDYYRARPLPEACVAFRHSNVRVLQISSSDGASTNRGSFVSSSSSVTTSSSSITNGDRSSSNGSNMNVTALDLLPCLEMLRFDNVIIELDLTGCKVGNSGAIAVGDMLPMATHLKVLAMSGCDISELGATALLRGVARAPALQKLFLRGNRIGVGGAIGLAMVLRKTRTISFVDVSNNFLTTEGVRLVTQALLSRAQARIARRANAASLGAFTRTTNSSSESNGNSISNNSISSTVSEDLSSVTSGRGFGWLFGEVSGLVITTRSVVKTNWGDNRSLFDATNARDAKSYGAFFKAQNNTSGNSKSPHPHQLSRQKRSSSGRALVGNEEANAGDLGGQIDIGGGGGLPHLPTVDEARSRVSTGLINGVDITSSSSSFGSIGVGNKHHHGIVPSDDDSLDVEIEVVIAGNFRREDLYDAAIHGIGLILSLIGGLVLIAKARQVEGETGTRLLVGYALYDIGLVSLFFTSTLSHSLHMVDSHFSFQLLSQSAIYLLIAGSYSPFFLVNLEHVQIGGWLFLTIWALALSGIALTSSCGRRKGESLSNASSSSSATSDREWSGARAVIFALMGWLALVPRQLLPVCLDERGWQLLLIGGVLFICGVGLYVVGRAQQVTRHRTMISFWYVLVVLACIIHYFAIYFFVEGPNTACMRAAVDGGMQLQRRDGVVGISNSKSSANFGLQEGDQGGEALLLSITHALEKAVYAKSDSNAFSALKEIVFEFGEKGRDAIANALREALVMVERSGGGGGGGGGNKTD
jgi:hemolysin III